MTRAFPISVVLPTYNGVEFLRESIESVLAQDTDDFELIVCDDGSNDGTREILDEYTGPRCRIIRNERNLGLFPTLNRLMREATTEWVHLWSQDDRMLPGCLRRTVEFAKAHPDAGMIYSRMYFIDDRGHRFSEGKDDITPEVVSPQLAARIMYYFGSIAGNIANVTLRRDAFEELGGFREDLLVSGDYEFWSRLSEKFPIGFQPELLLELRTHSGQFSRQSRSGPQFIRENREIHDSLYARLTEAERPRARHFREWVVQVNSFHQAAQRAVRGDLKTSAEVLGLLRSESALLPLAARWLLSVNGRRIPRPRLIPEKETVIY